MWGPERCERWRRGWPRDWPRSTVPGLLSWSECQTARSPRWTSPRRRARGRSAGKGSKVALPLIRKTCRALVRNDSQFAMHCMKLRSIARMGETLYCVALSCVVRHGKLQGIPSPLTALRRSGSPAGSRRPISHLCPSALSTSSPRCLNGNATGVGAKGRQGISQRRDGTCGHAPVGHSSWKGP